MFIVLNQRGTAVTPPLLENAFLKKLLVSGESHFLIGRSSHPFYKTWLKGLHLVAHRCVVTFGQHCFQDKDTAMCKARLALCLLGYIPEICS